MNNISNDKSWKYSDFIENSNYNFDKNKIFIVLSKNEMNDDFNMISSLLCLNNVWKRSYIVPFG